MDDLLRDFLTESSENLGKLDNAIIQLEQRPGDLGLLNAAFRTIHTIKGTCGFLGLGRLEGIAHAAENVLDALRSGDLLVQPALIGDVLAAVDCIKFVLLELEATETEPVGDDTALIVNLERWLRPADAAAPTAAAPTRVASATVAISDPHPRTAAPPAEAPQDALVAPAAAISADLLVTPRATIEDGAAATSAVAESTLRVSVEVLDKLMNLVGELALGRNQLLQLASAHDDSPFAKPMMQLDRVTTDLLEAVMKTRMQPIGNAWTKLPRLIRDLSQSSGKQIDLVMRGAETELDRQILQAIQDPLTHMVRNSADHGIETTAIRVAAGKPEKGTVTLSARHEGGHVVIEITDDGAGINAERVRRKAVERGLVKAEAAAALPDAQVFRFIFEPGFSTAEQITNVSGRGVGMDVVRSNIDAIGGTVELASTFGHGTTVRIKIPLTLAIISALLIGTAGETFAIPQIGIVELVRVTEDQRTLVETISGAQFYRLRDTLLPLVTLRGLLSLDDSGERDTYNIVVCQVDREFFGLVVDDVFDTQEIVVKPVGRLVKNLKSYAGCTITGDGRVIMILDTTGIASMAGIASDNARRNSGPAAANTGERATLDLLESVLLVDSGYPALQAIPLSLVSRLEEFAQTSLEEADGQFLVQYRGALMPVLGANPAIDIRALDPRPVIVFSDRTRTIGLAVNAIRDIVDVHLDLQRGPERPGVLGVAVIAGRATEVIDTDHFLRLAHGVAPTAPVPLASSQTDAGAES